MNIDYEAIRDSEIALYKEMLVYNEDINMYSNILIGIIIWFGIFIGLTVGITICIMYGI